MTADRFQCKMVNLDTGEAIQDVVRRESYPDGDQLYYDSEAYLPAVPRVGEVVIYGGVAWKVREVVYEHRVDEVVLRVVPEMRETPYRG